MDELGIPQTPAMIIKEVRELIADGNGLIVSQEEKPEWFKDILAKIKDPAASNGISILQRPRGRGIWSPLRFGSALRSGSFRKRWL